MASLIGWRGMRHVYAFQFWAERGGAIPILQIPPAPANMPVSPNMLGNYNYASLTCLCPPNTAPGQLWTQTVTVSVAQETQVFEFVDVGDPPTIPGAIAVEVASGATGPQVATELADVITDWCTDTFGIVETPVYANVDPDVPSRVVVVSLEPALATAMRIATSSPLQLTVRNDPGNKPYGAYVLRSAWKAFVCTGNSNPAGVAIQLDHPSMFWAVCGIVPTRGSVPRYVTPMQIWGKALGAAPG